MQSFFIYLTVVKVYKPNKSYKYLSIKKTHKIFIQIVLKSKEAPINNDKTSV